MHFCRSALTAFRLGYRAIGANGITDAMQRKLPSTVLLANSLFEANGMAASPLQADVVGIGLYAVATS